MASANSRFEGTLRAVATTSMSKFDSMLRVCCSYSQQKLPWHAEAAEYTPYTLTANPTCSSYRSTVLHETYVADQRNMDVHIKDNVWIVVVIPIHSPHNINRHAQKWSISMHIQALSLTDISSNWSHSENSHQS